MLVTLDDTQPLHRQIYENLRDMVLAGRFKANQKLPASRELARNLSVSRTTVLQAYEQLAAEGYIHTRSGSGTYVSTFARPPKLNSPQRGNNPPRFLLSDSMRQLNLNTVPMFQAVSTLSRKTIRYDFRMGSVRMDNRSRQIWRSLVSNCLRERTDPTHGPRGSYTLRVAVAEHLQRVRNCHYGAENIVITSGAQQAFDLLGRLLLNQGDVVAMENPGYIGAKLAFDACRAKYVYVDVDENGMKVEQLGKRARVAKLIYVTPSHQFPTGSIMSLSRRMALIDWVHTHNACIIEDDYDSEFHYDGRPLEAIQAIDPHDRTIYVGTFSKVLSPALRLGYVVLPDSLLNPFVSLRWIAGMESIPLHQEALARWMTEGYHVQHLRRMHKIYRERHAILLAGLKKYFSEDEIHIDGSNTGLHILVWLKRVPADKGMTCQDALWEKSIGIYCADIFYNKPPGRCGFVIGFGLIDARDIEKGIRLFQQTVVKYYR